MKMHPPKWADGFLKWYCDPDLLEEIQGDLYELYHCRLAAFGRRYADLRFVWEVFWLLRFSLLKNPFAQEKKIPLVIENESMNSGGMMRVLRLPAWNDILFERRNKDYGAYVIRNAYGINMLLGFSIVLSIWIVIVLWWWIRFKQ